jgi:crotonobetainyl-CoA:carnitine CoA-transferase CaiB-like acyl-CoA transferase
MVAGPIATDEPPPARAAPALGADTDAVLGECGFSPDEIADLHAERVI